MPVKYKLGTGDTVDVTAITKTNQGAGSGLDSDTVDGLHASVLELIANKGVANGYPNLNASSLVVQNPASKGQVNGLAELDSGGKVPSSQLPALALTDIWTVASEAAQIALTAQEGDVAIRTDQNKSYVHNGGTAGTMADWSLLLTPTDAVLSVFGRTGAVVAQANDYAWGQIDKTISSLADITTRSHTLLSDIGTNTHPQIDTHITDPTIHFLQTAIDHVNLLNKGTNTHAQIDTHLGAVSPHSGHELIASKNQANGFPGLSAVSKIAGTQITYGSLVNTACEGDDSRLSDSRTPTAHASTHNGGADPVTPSGIGAIAIPASSAWGDILFRDTSGWTRLPAGTSGLFLKTQGVGADPVWAAGAGGATDFLGLTDTPDAYTGQAKKVVRVNTGATALEFVSELDALILSNPKIKDVDATPVDDVLLKVIDGILKVRNSADSADAQMTAKDLLLSTRFGVGVAALGNSWLTELEGTSTTWGALLRINDTNVSPQGQGSISVASQGTEVFQVSNLGNMRANGYFNFNYGNTAKYGRLTEDAGEFLGLQALGTDTDIDLEIRPKGAGVLYCNGYLKVGSKASLPTAGSAYRGWMARVEGGAGVADRFYICEKTAADTYAWRELDIIYGNTASTSCEGDDSRLSDSRTPTAHASTHNGGGGDPVTPSGIGAIPHSLATAVDDFLVASGTGVFVKKTLAEAKAILGITIKPSFSVHKNSVNQTGIVNGVETKLTWAAEEFDTNNNFASSRFTPTVAGKYQLNAVATLISMTDTATCFLIIYKNGGTHKQGAILHSSTTGLLAPDIATIVSANGTTDYFEAYVYQTSGSNKDVSGSPLYTHFSGCKID